MSKRPKNKSARSKQLARQRACRAARRAADYPLLRLKPPFALYQEWIFVPEQAKDVIEYPLQPEDAEKLSDSAKDLLNTCIKLGPRYQGAIPMAAIHLDAQLCDGVIKLAVTGQPLQFVHVPIADMAATLSDPDEMEEILQRVPDKVAADLTGPIEPVTADACAWNFHELHINGFLIVDDDHVVHMALPPKTPGGTWQLSGHAQPDA